MLPFGTNALNTISKFKRSQHSGPPVSDPCKIQGIPADFPTIPFENTGLPTHPGPGAFPSDPIPTGEITPPTAASARESTRLSLHLATRRDGGGARLPPPAFFLAPSAVLHPPATISVG